MKIDILADPQVEIFKNQPRYAKWFVFFLGVALVGLLLGIYAYLNPASPWYGILEKAAMVLFVGSSIPIFITGEKLQAYKILTESQEKELEKLCEKYSEVRNYCGQVEALDRRLIFAEFDACKDFAEERELQLARQEELEKKQQEQ